MEPVAWAGLEQAIETALASDGPAVRIVAAESEVGPQFRSTVPLSHHSTILGSVFLYPPAAQAYAGAVAELAWPELRLLAVSPEKRGRGIGRALVDECARRSRASGARSLGLHTSRSMAVARRMYERLGFVRVPELDFQPPGAELVEGFRLPMD
jgi:GNAT superfamily N-acetyltransferase